MSSIHRKLLAASATTLALLVGTPLISSTVAHAQPSGAQADAEAHYTKGDTAYNLGRFDEAADEFTKAYEAWPQPEFLYNIAQSYRLGGNCKQALHFYKRFKSLKEKDKDNPLSKKKKAEIDKFILDLEECAKTTAEIGGQPPDGIDKPPGGGTKPPGDGTKPPGDGTKPPGDGTVPDPDGDPGDGEVAVVDGDGDDGDDDDLEIEDGTEYAGPKLVSARLGLGIAVISAGDLKVPVQPAFNLTAGYPLPVGPVNLDLGLGLGYSPVPYRTMANVSETGSLLSVHANVGATYPVTPQIGIRADVGLGVMAFGGLVAGNPFTEGGTNTSGALSMFNLRFAVAADYAFTDNLVASLTPFAFSYSPAAAGLDMDSLTHIDFLLGVGYRM